jgi:SPP1 gp7 family putative phage head morphogenesis protein
MSALEIALMSLLVSQAVDISRLDASERARIMVLLETLERNLTALLSVHGLLELGRQATNTLLREVTALIGEAYTEMAVISAETAQTLAGIETRATVQTLESILQITLGKSSIPSATYLEKLASDVMIQGSPTADFWAKQAGDLDFRFAAQLRQGLVAGETNQQIIARIVGTPDIPGVMPIARKNAATLVHSSVQTVANSARLALYRKNSDIIQGVRWMATLDSHVCEICAPRDLEWWDLDGVPQDGNTLEFMEPPLHPNCRCILVAVLRSNTEQGNGLPDFPAFGSTRAASGGPVKGGTSFETWFKSRSSAQQDEQFGPGKAAMFRAGKITVRDMVDGSGSPLTLAQLAEKHK